MITLRGLLARLLPFIGLVFFAGALYLIYQELKGFSYREVVQYLSTLPVVSVVLAVLFTVLNYVVLTGYDTLALRYVKQPLAYYRTALAAFIGYSFSIALGHALITGGAVRYRLYTHWELSAGTIARILVFCGSAFWIGYFGLGSVVFLLLPLQAEGLSLPVSPTLIGVFLLVGLVAYLAASAFVRAPIRLRNWEFEMPSLKLALGQAMLGSLDFVLAAAVVYVLLPEVDGMDLPFGAVLGAYMLAVMAGAISQVPGGLGVFDGAMLLLLTPPLSPSGVLGALLAYRAIYYLFPLLMAAAALAGVEVMYKREAMGALGKQVQAWLPRVVPQVLAVVIFIAGAVLLFSGALPAEGSQLRWLSRFVPLAVVEASHFVGSLAGAGLLVLARGIQRRLDVAYGLTLLLLGAGIVVSMLWGGNVGEAIFLTLVLAALAPCRSYFYRKSTLSARPTASDVAAILGVLVATAWLGFFAYNNVRYTDQLWWQFASDAEAPRFLRGLVGAAGVVLIAGFVHLIRARPHLPDPPSPEDLARARAIIRGEATAEPNLALMGDKHLLFNDEKSAFLMYAVQRNSWIAMGGPVGPEGKREAVFWQFHEVCDLHGGQPVFYKVHPADRPLCLELGLSQLKLGEEAVVPLGTFTLEGEARSSQRQSLRRVEREGGVFEVVPVDEAPALLPELRAVSEEWLRVKNTREKGFSLGFFSEAYMRNFPIAVVRREGRVVAFTNLWMGLPGTELSADLVRYSREAPDGVMEYLFTRVMLWGKAEGYTRFNLGMAPLQGLEDQALEPLWNRLGALLFRHGEHFDDVQGLRRYKEKFGPEWEPRYLAAPGGLALPGVLFDLTALISGGLIGMVGKPG